MSALVSLRTMVGARHMDRYDFFIVRVWRRDGASGEQWTGRLEHLQGQDSWRFGDLDALLSCLRALLSRLEDEEYPIREGIAPGPSIDRAERGAHPNLEP